MRIFYMKKSSLKAAALILGVFFLIFLAWTFLGTKPQSVLAEPIYRGDAAQKKVALAINVDWGEDIIPGMLDILEKKDACATFFITGRFAEKFPDLVKEIAQSGQEIQSHGYAHGHPDKLSTEDNTQDILRAEAVLKEIRGQKPRFLAPAYGEHGESIRRAAEENAYRLIMWTVDTVDWRDSDPAVIAERASGEKIVNGAIVLMHPKSHTLEALPHIIDNLHQKGYTLVGISEIVPDENE